MARVAAARRAERAQLIRELARDAIARDRATVKAARAAIAELRAKLRAGRAQIAAECRAARLVLRERHAAERAALRERLGRERGEQRSICASNRQELTTRGAAELLEAARRKAGALETAREHRAARKLEAIWSRPAAPPRSRQQAGQRAAEVRAESDAEVLREIPPQLHEVYRRVRGKIKGTPYRSRAEAFLEWVEEHGDEAYAIQAEADYAALRALEREEQRVSRELRRPSGYRHRAARRAEEEVPF